MTTTLYDVQATLRRVLLDQPDLSNMVGGRRLFLGTTYDHGYEPRRRAGDSLTGPGIVLTVQTGRIDQNGVLGYPSVASRCIAETRKEAWELDGVLVTALNNLTTGGVLRQAVLVTTSEDQPVPDTGWPSVVAAYKLVVVIQPAPTY